MITRRFGPPGAAFFYSGAGYQLAGFVAQQAAGIPWTQLFQQRIGTPLGLAGFSYVGNDNPRIGGGALSDTSDYLRITRMFLDGGRAGDATVLSEQSAASVTWTPPTSWRGSPTTRPKT